MRSGRTQSLANRASGQALPLALIAVLLPSPAEADATLYGRIRNPLLFEQQQAARIGEPADRGGQWDLRLRALPQPEALGLDAADSTQRRSPGDAFDLALDWGALSAGAGYSDIRGDGLDAQDPWRLNASFRSQRFGLSGQYEQTDPDGGDVFSEWSLLGEYYFGDSTLRAIFSDQQNDEQQQRSWALGLQHAFSERTRVYSEYQDSDDRGGSQIGVGLRYDF